MTASLSRKTSAGLLSLGMAATVGGALAFEHIGGYIPCALCLLQRDPYYYGIPVAVAALLSALFGGPVWLTRLLLAIAGIMMLVGAGMGVSWIALATQGNVVNPLDLVGPTAFNMAQGLAQLGLRNALAPSGGRHVAPGLGHLFVGGQGAYNTGLNVNDLAQDGSVDGKNDPRGETGLDPGNLDFIPTIEAPEWADDDAAMVRRVADPRGRALRLCRGGHGYEGQDAENRSFHRALLSSAGSSRP